MNRLLIPALAALQTGLLFAQAPPTNVLILLNDQPQRIAPHNLIERHLRSLGASAVTHYTSFNAVSAVLPPLTLDRLSADPIVAKVLSYPPASSRALFDLLDRIDRAATSSSTRAIDVTLPADIAEPGPDLSQLVDQLIDDYQLTVILQGGSGVQANAITIGPASAQGIAKSDFIGAGSASSVRDAIARMTQSGVTHPLARKAILISSAKTTSGWSSDSGWGLVDPDGAANQADCGVGANPSHCLLGATASSRSYVINSGSPAKITAVWNQGAVLHNLELHVYDMAHHELAADITARNNVHQVTAQSDGGLIVEVALSQPIASTAAPLEFALASSVPMTGPNVTCTGSPTITISPSSLHFLAQGGTQSVTITTGAPGCNWSVGPGPRSQDIFALPNPGSGVGSSSVLVTAVPNVLPRTLNENLVAMPDGFLGPSIPVTQDAGTGVQCTYTAAATGTLPLPATGGSAGINITASDPTCGSSLSNDSPAWLTLSPASSSGNWAPVLTAAPNVQLNTSTSQRSAQVVVNGAPSSSGPPFTQGFSISQSGVSCSFTVPSTPFSIPAAGISQSAPQSFTVGVSNAACPWNASSPTSFVHVVNQGVTQTGSTSYSVKYWADPNTTTTKLPATIKAGDQTYSGNEDAPPTPSITITSPADGATFTVGDVVTVKWNATNLAAGDAATATLATPTQPESGNSTNGNQPIQLIPLPKDGPAGTSQKCTLTVKDNVKGTSANITVNIIFPAIKVNYPPAGKAVESRNHPDAVTWTLTPAGAQVQKVDIAVVVGGKAKIVATVDGSLLSYQLSQADFAGINPGTMCQIRISNWMVSDTSGQFKLGGFRITTPADGAEFLNNKGDFTVGWSYIGDAKNVLFALGAGAGQTFPIGKNDGTEVTHAYTVKAGTIGPLRLFATTTGVADTDTDGVDITLDGIAITGPAAVSGGRQQLVVTWKAVGNADTVGKTCKITLIRSGGGTATSATADVAAGTVTLPQENLNAPHGGSVTYTIEIVSDTNARAQSTLTVNGK